jgi:transcriptional regulator with XRE-family HTH domain
MNTPQIITAIRDRRKELKRTQAWVAEVAEIARETYSRFEQGKHDISLRRLLRICSALGLDLLARPGSGRPTLEELDQVFGGDDD